MNFRNMPELQREYGYPFAIASMAVIDTFLYLRFRKAAWL